MRSNKPRNKENVPIKMRKMKRSQIMLKFLFYLILALVIFVPTVIWASRFLTVGYRADDSYSKLVEMVSGIKEGELLSMPLYMDRNSIIFGIGNKGAKFESRRSISGTTGNKVFFEGQQDKCGSSSCLCICKDIKTENSQGGQKIICQKESRCAKLEGTSIITRYDPSDIGIESAFKPKVSAESLFWNNGFAIATQIDNDLRISLGTQMYDEVSKNTKPIYIEKRQGIVNVCYTSKCLSESNMDFISKEAAIAEFSKFRSFYLQCTADKDKCGTIAISLPQRYYILYLPSDPSLFSYFSKKNVFLLLNSQTKDADKMKDSPEAFIARDDSGNDVSFPGQFYSGVDQIKEYEKGFIPQDMSIYNDNGRAVMDEEG